MGTSIYGWVETNSSGKSNAVFSPHLETSYEIFALLFGIHYSSYENIFLPMAEKRGFPQDTHIKTRVDYAKFGKDAHSASWITWEEIQQADWDEPYFDDRPFQFARDKGRKRITYPRRITYPAIRADTNHADGEIWRFGLTTVRHVLHRVLHWQMLFSAMDVLAREYGDDMVRFVAWFCT